MKLQKCKCHPEDDIHYSKKLEEQIFDVRFFSMVKLDILGVVTWNRCSCLAIRTMYCDLLKFHLAGPKYLVFLPDWNILRQKFVPLIFWSSVFFPEQVLSSWRTLSSKVDLPRKLSQLLGTIYQLLGGTYKFPSALLGNYKLTGELRNFSHQNTSLIIFKQICAYCTKGNNNTYICTHTTTYMKSLSQYSNINDLFL